MCTAIPGLDLFTNPAPCGCVECLAERFEAIPPRRVRRERMMRLDRVERRRRRFAAVRSGGHVSKVAR